MVFELKTWGGGEGAGEGVSGDLGSLLRFGVSPHGVGIGWAGGIGIGIGIGIR